LKVYIVKIFVILGPILAALINIFIMWTLGTGGLWERIELWERIDLPVSVFFPVYYGFVQTIIFMSLLFPALRFYKSKTNKTAIVVYVVLTLTGLMAFNTWCAVVFSLAC